MKTALANYQARNWMLYGNYKHFKVSEIWTVRLSGEKLKVWDGMARDEGNRGGQGTMFHVKGVWAYFWGDREPLKR